MFLLKTKTFTNVHLYYYCYLMTPCKFLILIIYLFLLRILTRRLMSYFVLLLPITRFICNNIDPFLCETTHFQIMNDTETSKATKAKVDCNPLFIHSDFPKQLSAAILISQPCKSSYQGSVATLLKFIISKQLQPLIVYQKFRIVSYLYSILHNSVSMILNQFPC